MVRPVGESVSTDVTPTGQHRFALLFQKSWKSPETLGFEKLVSASPAVLTRITRPRFGGDLTPHPPPKSAQTSAKPGISRVESYDPNQ
ncbi:hypothetical protein SPHINGOAX6_40137 [Sphingomonas sp. AX6]|nr:hypothetical protein SPHINGOAX6_40137 [Sphingomonas sp. AX6]